MVKDALFEIGLEELPARFVDDAERQLKDKTRNWLEELRISFDSITSFSTPRRLAVVIAGIAEEQSSLEEEIKGPAEKIARNAEGDWTKAAIGFTKGQGKTVDDIYTKEVNGATYIFVKKQITGKQTFELLSSFDSIIETIQFSKNMRWAEENLRYARPIRWIVALYGNKIIPLEVAGVTSDAYTYGHRFLGEKMKINEPLDYQDALRKNYVMANPEEREQFILDGIRRIEKDHEFIIPIDEDLLKEVRNLVEYPTAFMGSFDESFLQLPPDVLVISMKEHQRYFPVKSKEGTLLPYFIGVRNGDEYALQTVVQGNEKVLRARLSDAQFFFQEDKTHSIDYYQKKLERVVFQEKLGTIRDKVSRVVTIADQLSQALNVDEKTRENVLRAAEICKFDLPTNMVNEFTELQGVIGETYALYFGEGEVVAKSIKEHYLPVHADDKLPTQVEGAIVSIADKLDTIVGCISVGLIPTGSQDPYGLRRQAAGILKILKQYQWNVTMEALLDLTQHVYGNLSIEQDDKTKVRTELDRFFQLRMEHLLKERNMEQDVIRAVLSKGIGVVTYSIDKAKILSKKRNDDNFKHTHEAMSRILNLGKKSKEINVDPTQFITQSENNLYEMYKNVKNDYFNAKDTLQAEEALLKLGELTEPIHAFFERNMVMIDDETIRTNRLSLVNTIALLLLSYANFSVIEWKKQS